MSELHITLRLDASGRRLQRSHIFFCAADTIRTAIQTHNVVSKGFQEKHVVTAAAAGDERGAADDAAGIVTERVAAAVDILRRNNKVVALGQQIGEGYGWATAIPRMEVMPVKIVPRGFLVVAGGSECVSEDVGIGGVWGGHDCGQLRARQWDAGQRD